MPVELVKGGAVSPGQNIVSGGIAFRKVYIERRKVKID